LPTPADVSSLVDNAVINVFAVLIKHNLLSSVATKLLENKNNANVTLPEGIVRVWRTAQKLRSWLLQKYQALYSAKQQELQKKKNRTRRKKKKKKIQKNVKKRSSKCSCSYSCNGKPTCVS